MGISSPGIGSNLDVNGIVSKLMAVEAQPLSTIAKKEASFQAKLSALGSLSGAVSSFQGSLGTLKNAATFQAVSAISNDTSVMIGAATSKAAAGTYNINVTQIAQSQTLASSGQLSSSASIGLGGSTTLSFQFGTASGGSFGVKGSALGAGVASGGIADGSLTINGTAITTDTSTTSAKLLAAAINSKSSTSGVTATAATDTGTLNAFATTTDGLYSLSVGGVSILSGAAIGQTAADVNSAVAAAAAALTAAGITASGDASISGVGGLKFTRADGSNVVISEDLSNGSASGGLYGAAAGAVTNQTYLGSVTMSSTSLSPITVAGSSPTSAGLTAGAGGAYLGSGFAQDGDQASGTVVIDSTNNSLQGIRDAINKANLGVNATIVSDGGATPFHLVLTSNKTGASSTLKISVSGSPADTAISDLMAYDPAGTQKLTQNKAAQSTALTVNGIAVVSATTTVSEAIEGVTLTIGKIGAANLSVARDTGAAKSGVTAFVKAYNDFNTTVKNLTSYDPATKKGGDLLGDATTAGIQSLIRKQMSTPVAGLGGSLTNLSQVGISFQKDGSLSLDSGKLQTALTNSFTEIGGLFAALGKASDSLINFNTSTSATKAGSYAVNLTALASKGSLVGNKDLTTGTITIAADTTWNVDLNATDPVTASTSASVSITAGNYTAAQLATMVQSAINGASSYSAAGVTATASIDATSGFLKLESNRYGSTSKISVSSGTGTTVDDVFGVKTETAGVDVAGTIGGAEATGSGQTLAGATGTDADGLKLDVTGGVIGARGTVDFSQGYAYQLNNLTASFLGAKGLITARTDGIGTTIKDIGHSRDDFNAKLLEIEKRYRTQFTALDVAIGRMTTTQSFLTQQLASLSSLSK